MLHTRLKKLRMEKDLTQAALARELNVTQQAVAKWEAGKSLPDHAMLLRLAQYYGVSVDYLLGLPAALPGDGFTGPVLVPVVGAVRAGYNAFAFEEHMGSEPAGVRSPEGYFYLVVRGDSMEPYIHDGDLALVRRQQTLEDGDVGVMVYRDGEGTLKRFHRRADGVALEPFNQAYETLVITGAELDQLYIIGRVVETKTRW